MSETKTVWHPYPNQKPKIEGEYLVTSIFGSIKEVVTGYFESGRFDNEFDNCVKAWAELPKPYNPEENNNESR